MGAGVSKAMMVFIFHCCVWVNVFKELGVTAQLPAGFSGTGLWCIRRGTQALNAWLEDQSASSALKLAFSSKGSRGICVEVSEDCGPLE